MVLDSSEMIHWGFSLIGFCLFCQSLGFWRVVSRKFFAIPETEYGKETPPSAKKKRKSCSSAIQSDSAFMQEAVESLVEGKSRRRSGKVVNLLFDISFLYHLFHRLTKHFDAQFVM